MSGILKRRRWGRTVECGWGFEDLCRMDIRLNGKYEMDLIPPGHHGHLADDSRLDADHVNHCC